MPATYQQATVHSSSIQINCMQVIWRCTKPIWQTRTTSSRTMWATVWLSSMTSRVHLLDYLKNNLSCPCASKGRKIVATSRKSSQTTARWCSSRECAETLLPRVTRHLQPVKIQVVGTMTGTCYLQSSQALRKKPRKRRPSLSRCHRKASTAPNYQTPRQSSTSKTWWLARISWPILRETRPFLKQDSQISKM